MKPLLAIGDKKNNYIYGIMAGYKQIYKQVNAHLIKRQTNYAEYH